MAGGGGGLGSISGTLTASPAALTLNVPANKPDTQTVTLSYRNAFKGAALFQTTGPFFFEGSPGSAQDAEQKPIHYSSLIVLLWLSAPGRLAES